MPYMGRVPSPVPVTVDDIPANSIDASKIIDGSIELAEISDGAISLAKLSATGTASTSNYLRGDNSWSEVDGLPTQTSNAGKYLGTDGTTASWESLVEGVSEWDGGSATTVYASTDIILESAGA